MLKTHIFLSLAVAGILLLISPGGVYAGGFSCNCQNGTNCLINCRCSGTASCGYDKCTGTCGVCKREDVDNQRIAESIGFSIFRNGYILTNGGFTKEDVVGALIKILNEGEIIDQYETIDGPYVTVMTRYKVIKADLGDFELVIHIPENAYLKKDEVIDIVKSRIDKILGHPLLSPDYLKRFFQREKQA